jgi:hypothetical protein
MRRLITGMKDGKSCVVKVLEFEGDGPDVVMQDFIELALNPLPARPRGRAAFLDLGVAPGKMKWVTTYGPPNSGHPTMHHTNTIDCHTVIAGSIDLILDDGTHTLSAGDCAIIMGVDHAWMGRATGCKSSIIFIGTEPPADEAV